MGVLESHIVIRSLCKEFVEMGALQRPHPKDGEECGCSPRPRPSPTYYGLYPKRKRVKDYFTNFNVGAVLASCAAAITSRGYAPPRGRVPHPATKDSA